MNLNRVQLFVDYDENNNPTKLIRVILTTHGSICATFDLSNYTLSQRNHIVGYETNRLRSAV